MGALKPYMGKNKSQISLTWCKQSPKERAGQEREPMASGQDADCISNSSSLLFRKMCSRGFTYGLGDRREGPCVRTWDKAVLELGIVEGNPISVPRR